MSGGQCIGRGSGLSVKRMTGGGSVEPAGSTRGQELSHWNGDGGTRMNKRTLDMQGLEVSGAPAYPTRTCHRPAAEAVASPTRRCSQSRHTSVTPPSRGLTPALRARRMEACRPRTGVPSPASVENCGFAGAPSAGRDMPPQRLRVCGQSIGRARVGQRCDENVPSVAREGTAGSELLAERLERRPARVGVRFLVCVRLVVQVLSADRAETRTVRSAENLVREL
jgi:hypothetical protein